MDTNADGFVELKEGLSSWHWVLPLIFVIRVGVEWSLTLDPTQDINAVRKEWAQRIKKSESERLVQTLSVLQV